MVYVKSRGTALVIIPHASVVQLIVQAALSALVYGNDAKTEPVGSSSR